MVITQKAGLAIIMMMMALALFNDITRLIVLTKLVFDRRPGASRSARPCAGRTRSGRDFRDALRAGFRLRTLRDPRHPRRGVQRTEPGTFSSPAGTRGRPHHGREGDEAVKALFATGFFRDVRLEVEGDVLVVYVERLAIASVDITGGQGVQTRTR
ncbi:MAG: hypothetical protein R3E41_08810 [Burkholderiaceae bacterium]